MAQRESQNQQPRPSLPLTTEEVNLALTQMKPGKSPGPDGLTTG